MRLKERMRVVKDDVRHGSQVADREVRYPRYYFAAIRASANTFRFLSIYTEGRIVRFCSRRYKFFFYRKSRLLFRRNNIGIYVVVRKLNYIYNLSRDIVARVYDLRTSVSAIVKY